MHCSACLKRGSLCHFVAAVVHQDDVQLFRRAVGVWHLAGDDRDVAGKQLRGGAAGSAVRIGVMSSKCSISFSSPTMATWMRGRVVTSRALPSLVTITMLPVSATAMLAPLMPMSALRNFGRSLPRANFTSFGISAAGPSSTLLAENLGNLLLGHVDGGHHHVRGRLAGKLDDPLAQIGLVHLNAGLFQVLVEMDFLRGHGLGLDDALYAAFLRQVQNVVLHGLRVAGAENLGAAGLGRVRKVLGQLIEVRGGRAT